MFFSIKFSSHSGLSLMTTVWIPRILFSERSFVLVGITHSCRYSGWHLSLHTSTADALSPAAQNTLAAGHRAGSWHGCSPHLLNKFDPVLHFKAQSVHVMAAGRMVGRLQNNDRFIIQHFVLLFKTFCHLCNQINTSIALQMVYK